MFSTLHLLFEQQYLELAIAVDTSQNVSEHWDFLRRAVMHHFLCSRLSRKKLAQPPASAMLKQLIHGQETVTQTARALFPTVSEAHDEPTADLLTQRIANTRKKMLGCYEVCWIKDCSQCRSSK